MQVCLSLKTLRDSIKVPQTTVLLFILRRLDSSYPWLAYVVLGPSSIVLVPAACRGLCSLKEGLRQYNRPIEVPGVQPYEVPGSSPLLPDRPNFGLNIKFE